jgi:hypothetical protein
MDGGFAAGNLNDVGFGLVGDDAIEHAFDLVERLELGAMGSGLRVADGTGKIAGVADFEEREAGMLLVVGTEAAVVGTSEFNGRVVPVRHLGRLDKDFATAPVVVHIIRYEDALEAVGRTTLEHEDVIFFEDDLGVDAAVTGGTDGNGGVVVEVRANAGGHGCPLVVATCNFV